jgi:hypothetical protein
VLFRSSLALPPLHYYDGAMPVPEATCEPYHKPACFHV